ncbi:hypothetical protein PYCC9005_004329 [Savitreella phatthalungensis]
MVLHNDKWKAKARRQNEKKHGVKHVRHSQIRQEARQAAAGGTVAPNASGLPRPSTSTQTADDEEEESGEEYMSSSFEDDSDDEGKTAEEIRLSELRRDQARRDRQAQREAEAATNGGTSSKELKAHTESSAPDGADGIEGQPVLDEPRGKYSRRKVRDNAYRYEEAPLDPYIVAEEDIVLEPDFARMHAREWKEVNEEELVPDLTKRQPPQIMTDVRAFDDYRARQQKEEIARDLRQRFGSRRKPERRTQANLNGNDNHNDNNDDDDDDFFAATLRKTECETQMRTEMKAEQESGNKASGDVKQLEGFLDDLLKL